MRPKPTITFVLAALFAAVIPSAGNGPRKITRQALEDKIRGGWAGKMIGVSYGAPTEFRARGVILEGPLKWSPERVSNSLGQDDLYVGMTMAETMDRLGFEGTVEQYGDAFRDSKYGLAHANAASRELLRKGIKAPMSGHPRYNVHANDIDFQIEADFIGLMAPGMPQFSNKYSDRVGRVMNYGDGLYGGMFISCMYTAAYFDTNMRNVVETGLACLPAKSLYARLIRDTLDWSAKYPADWRKVWQLIEDKYDKDEACPRGALQPFNIDASINGAYVALGVLYGAGDFGKTLEISTRAGQDSDCNPSTAAGILGVALGYSGIPDEWKSGIPAIADTKFRFTESSFNDISRSTMARALKLVAMAGGKVTETEVVVPYQAPKPAKLEQWSMGIPDKRVGIKDAAWEWKRQWSATLSGRAPNQTEAMRSAGAGAEVILTFTGVAVDVLGNFGPKDGSTEVYLDGKKEHPVSAIAGSLWHTYGLQPGPHTLRIVTGDTIPLTISEAIVFRAR